MKKIESPHTHSTALDLTLISVALLLGSLVASTVSAQTQFTPPTTFVQSQTASLTDYLISRLRATTTDQRDYVREIVRLVDEDELERRLVLAIERYSRKRRREFPLPIFERALRIEAAKRGVVVPMLKDIVARNGSSTARAIRDSRFR